METIFGRAIDRFRIEISFYRMTSGDGTMGSLLAVCTVLSALEIKCLVGNRGIVLSVEVNSLDRKKTPIVITQ